MNTSKKRKKSTGNLEAETEKEKPSILENGKELKKSTLPKRLITEPEILLAQLNDILLAMSEAGWFTLCQDEESLGINMLSVKIAPPEPHVIGRGGTIREPVITINGKPV